ncbi:hypothetical protein GCM10010363_75040 [Streptomyces omiyaensis]|nr:hypothetical protein GCM10010363_75040 [Streptomyces omiyaensis]
MLQRQEVLDVGVEVDAASGTTIGSRRRSSSSADDCRPRGVADVVREPRVHRDAQEYGGGPTRVAQWAGPRGVRPFAVVGTAVRGAASRGRAGEAAGNADRAPDSTAANASRTFCVR